MEIYLKILTIVLGSLVSAWLGFLAKTYFVNLSFRQNAIEAVVTRYLDARDDISDLLADCAVDAKARDTDWLLSMEQAIGHAYYKYFDYMPNEVIQELLCLQVCIHDAGNHLYKIEDGNLKWLDDSDLASFCETIARVGNIAPTIYYKLKSDVLDDICSRRIEYQAKYVLMNMNMYFTEENLTSLSLFRPKLVNFDVV